MIPDERQSRNVDASELVIFNEEDLSGGGG